MFPTSSKFVEGGGFADWEMEILVPRERKTAEMKRSDISIDSEKEVVIPGHRKCDFIRIMENFKPI